MASRVWCGSFHLPGGLEHAFKNRPQTPLKVSLEGLKVVRWTREEGPVQVKRRDMYCKRVASVTDSHGSNVVNLDLMARTISGFLCVASTERK